MRRATARMAGSTRVAALRDEPFQSIAFSPASKGTMAASAFSWTAQREIIEHKTTTGGPGGSTRIRLLYGRGTYTAL